MSKSIPRELQEDEPTRSYAEGAQNEGGGDGN